MSLEMSSELKFPRVRASAAADVAWEISRPKRLGDTYQGMDQGSYAGLVKFVFVIIGEPGVGSEHSRRLKDPVIR